MDIPNWSKQSWEVIDSYFRNPKQLLRHQIDSYNEFVRKGIVEIVRQFSPIQVSGEGKTYLMHLGGLSISRAQIQEHNGIVKPLYPAEARIRNITYASPLYMDINQEIRYHGSDGVADKIEQLPKISNVLIGKLPIMVQSDFCLLNESGGKPHPDCHECEFDMGAYFIINGTEKVLVGQERMCDNKVYIWKATKIMANKYSHVSEIRSVMPDKYQQAKTVSVKMSSKDGPFGPSLKVGFPQVKQDVSIAILFKALGVITDHDIIEIIVGGDMNDIDMYERVRPSIEEVRSMEIYTQEDALDYISKYALNIPKGVTDQLIKRQFILDALELDLFPHLGNNSWKKKGFFLGYMVNKLLSVILKRKKMDDRDHYSNKRVDAAGSLMAQLFRAAFTKLHKDIKTNLQKEMYSERITEISDNITKIIKPSTIDNTLKFAMATGNWGMKNNSQRQGVAQVLGRLTFINTVSHLRRLNTPIEKTGKLVPPRKLHSSHWGYICPNETPEGGSVGVVKNLALMSYITVNMSQYPVITVLSHEDIIMLENASPSEIFKVTKVMVNGNWIAITYNPSTLVSNLRKFRRTGIINPFISIVWDISTQEIQIWTDSGRLTRPLLIVDDNKLRIKSDDIAKIRQNVWTWNNLIVKGMSMNDDIHTMTSNEAFKYEGVIEYIDSSEMETCMIAVTPSDLKENDLDKVDDLDYFKRYTHCEIHPSMILGVLTASIPFPERNQAPRNTYQGAMGKQAMGIYSSNYLVRMDTLAHVLYYAQVPIVGTKILDYVNSSELPSGQNVIVAIACYTGYNQEDSVIMNKAFLERGGYRSSFYKLHKDEERKVQSSLQEEEFRAPDPSNTQHIKPGSYSKLDPNTGIVKKGTRVNGGDIIIGKVIPIRSSDKDSAKFYKDSSTQLRHNDSGVVDRTVIHWNPSSESFKFCKVRIRSERIPTVGDKFSSRHGQKGTLGIILPPEDMPFTKSGITPDIIMNPHAVPSRMTIGQLLECLLGKSSVIRGHRQDATAFNGMNVEDIADILEDEGYQRYGDEVLYNGMNGKQMKTLIFMGPTYYQRLKHMVEDKIHSRSTGPLQALTRQPSEGRARDGGLRFGEMERDCMIAHGASQFLKERLMDVSDNYMVFINKSSGKISNSNPIGGVFIPGQDSNDICQVHIPYAFKLLLQELTSMGISSKIMVA
jgi:DNA-directed RNA polymerase II subunit RPB2